MIGNSPEPAGFNALPADEARARLRGCCASTAWLDAVCAARPFADGEALLAASARALESLEWRDVEEALRAHPRIGERPTGADRESAWSRAEQSGVDADDRGSADLLRSVNAGYELTHGHVFLVCATGLSAREILLRMRARLENDPETERRITRTELAKIVRLRLTDLMELS